MAAHFASAKIAHQWPATICQWLRISRASARWSTSVQQMYHRCPTACCQWLRTLHPRKLPTNGPQSAVNDCVFRAPVYNRCQQVHNKCTTHVPQHVANGCALCAFENRTPMARSQRPMVARFARQRTNVVHKCITNVQQMYPSLLPMAAHFAPAKTAHQWPAASGHWLRISRTSAQTWPTSVPQM